MSENERVLWHQLAEFAERLRLSEIEHDRICCELKEQNKGLMRDNAALLDYVERLERKHDKLRDRGGIENCGVCAPKPEQEWYDAEKCLPMPHRKVVVELESQCPNKVKVWDRGELRVIDGSPMICCNGVIVSSGFGPKFKGPYKAVKWKYADE